MRLGIAPLAIAVALATANLAGATRATDLLACLYLTVVTVGAMRDGDLKVPQRV